MNRSQSKQFSIAEPHHYPTIKSLSSHTSILSLKDINERLNNLSLDINSMCMLAFQIKSSMANIQYSQQQCYQYGIRLMGIANCIFKHFAIHQYYLNKLVNCLKSCNQRWKRVLVVNLKKVNMDPDAYKIFMYKTNRNIYLLILLRTCNTMLSKIIDKLLSKKQLNQNAINYLCQNHIFISFQRVYSKMIQILEQKSEQTYLKIHLINEFIKYVLLYLNFCPTPKQEAKIYSKFFNIIEYSFRIIKKFQHPQISSVIQNTFSVIQRGLKFYVYTLGKESHNQVKINQIKHILRIIQQSPINQVKDNISQMAFVIKLILKILKNWRTIYQKAERSRKSSLMRSISEFNITKQIRKQKQHNLKQNLEAGKIDKVKLQFRKLSKSLTHLQRRRNSDKSERFGSCINANSNIRNRIKVTNGIQNDAFHCAQRFHSTNNNRSSSKQRKSNKDKSLQKHEHQLKLEDYQFQRDSRKKLLPTINKIQLYKSEKLSNYCAKKPKLKLDRNN